MPAAFAVLIAVAAGSVAYLVLLFNSQERGKRWRRAAEAAGLQDVGASRVLGVETKLTGTADGLEVTLQRYQRGRHEHGTRITIGGLRHGTYGLTLRAEGVTSRIEKTFGEREIELGDPDFDEAAYVQGAPGLVRAIFDAETRRLVQQLIAGLVHKPDGAPTRIRNFRVKVSSDELRLEIRSSFFDRTDDLLPEILGPLAEIARRLRRPADVAARLAEHTSQESLDSVRLANLRTLATEFPRHPATHEALTAALTDTSVEVRLQAALALGDSGRATLAALATGAVPDSIAARAIAALGAAFTAPQAVERLGRACRAGEVAAALACVDVLGSAGDPAAGPVLFEALATADGRLASAAARALGRLGDAAAEAALVEALAHDADDVRVAAAEALGRVGSALAVVPLRDASASHRLDGDLRKAVREAIAQIQSRVTGATPGQLSLAGPGVREGQVSLVEEDAGGRLSLEAPESADQRASSAEKASRVEEATAGRDAEPSQAGRREAAARQAARVAQQHARQRDGGGGRS